MNAPPRGSQCRPGVGYMLNGFIQLVASFTIAVMASALGVGLLERAGRAGGTAYLAWWAFVVVVVTVSVVHYVLALLHMWGTYQESIPVLVVWESAMQMTNVVQALVMVVALVLSMSGAWRSETCAEPLAHGGLPGWRAAMRAQPEPQILCLLPGLFGTWLFCLGVYWCYSICVNIGCVAEVCDSIDRNQMKLRLLHATRAGVRSGGVAMSQNDFRINNSPQTSFHGRVADKTWTQGRLLHQNNTNNTPTARDGTVTTV